MEVVMSNNNRRLSRQKVEKLKEIVIILKTGL